MSSSMRLCPDCRYCREPVRPSAFALGAARTPRQFDAATRELAEQERQRNEEETRVSGELPFDSEPEFFPWCSKFTLSEVEIFEINARLRGGDDKMARRIVEAGYASVDGTRGMLVRLYALCLRRNPDPYECSGFKGRQ